MELSNAVLTNVPAESRNVLFQCGGCGKDFISKSGKAPADWLNPHHCTRACRDKWLIKSLRQSGVGHRFLQASFENYEVSPETKTAYEISLQAASDLERGIFIYGSVGAGKTHLLAAIMRRMLERGTALPNQMRFIPILELLEEVKRSWSTYDAGPMERLKRVDALFIDDLGMEIVRDWTFQLFLSIISFRYNEDLPTFISSNLSEKELLDRYGSAVFSRIAQMCKIIRLSAPNYRMKKKRREPAVVES